MTYEEFRAWINSGKALQAARDLGKAEPRWFAVEDITDELKVAVFDLVMTEMQSAQTGWEFDESKAPIVFHKIAELLDNDERAIAVDNYRNFLLSHMQATLANTDTPRYKLVDLVEHEVYRFWIDYWKGVDTCD